MNARRFWMTPVPTTPALRAEIESLLVQERDASRLMESRALEGERRARPKLMGWGSAAGISLALVRKVRIAAWTLVGIAFQARRGISLKGAAAQSEFVAMDPKCVRRPVPQMRRLCSVAAT
jgi:hypothetical protein